MSLPCWTYRSCSALSSQSTSHACLLSFSTPGGLSLFRFPRKPSKVTCLVHPDLQDIAHLAQNKVLIAAGLSAAIGQLSKPFTSVLLYGKDLDFKATFKAGGFPSTHSSSVVAAATSLALERGFSDSIFGATVVYAGLIMYDAQGVRREVGNHAKALNTVLPRRQIKLNVSNDKEKLIDSQGQASSTSNTESRFGVSFESSGSLNSRPASAPLLIRVDKTVDQPEGVDEDGSAEDGSCDLVVLKESIGHTEVEVVAGAFLGFLVSLAVYSIM